MNVNIPESNLQRVVIIGGGFGGITLASALRKAPYQVVMFDIHNYHTFQPLLYQVATGGLEPDSIAFPIRKLFKRHRNFYFRMAEVREIDHEHNLIRTSIGKLGYDYLVIATGSRTNFFGNRELAQLSQGMKSIPEALDLRSLILQNFERALLTSDIDERHALMNFTVVGAGPTGLETAGALAELKKHILPADYPELDLRQMNIHIIEGGPRLLPAMSEKSSENAMNAIKKLGVNVWLNAMVKGYDGEFIHLDSGKDIPSRTVIWSAGVLGNVIKGLESVVVRGNRFEVDQFNRIKGFENIFAIGDVAWQTEEAWPKGHPMVAPVAIQHAQNLAKNLRRNKENWRPFAYRDKGSMATIGRNKAVVDVRKMHFSGRLAWLMWMGVHLFSLAGFRNRLVVFINWFWSYITYDKGTRLIIRPFRRKSARWNARELEEDESVPIKK